MIVYLNCCVVVSKKLKTGAAALPTFCRPRKRFKFARDTVILACVELGRSAEFHLFVI